MPSNPVSLPKAARSAKVFAVYLFIVGSIFAAAPNALLSAVGAPASTEVWSRVVGVMAFMIGVYAWVAAEHGLRPFLVASVYTRLLVSAAFATFAAAGLAHPILVLFGTVDLAGGIWTHLALRADASQQGATP